MHDLEHMLLSDHLAEALGALNRAREACYAEKGVEHREIVTREITSAEMSIARVLNLLVGTAS
jgi:hypothetical protein